VHSHSRHHHTSYTFILLAMMLRTCAALAMVMATAAIGQDLPYEMPSRPETILYQPLQSTFKCEGRPFGYYADVQNNCQVFHVCLPVTNHETRQFSFFCGRSTVFSQVDHTCVHRDMAPPCQDSQIPGGDTTGIEG
ncbi:unnamed protein product, partial [Meganyctiphanes norvegica]